MSSFPSILINFKMPRIYWDICVKSRKYNNNNSSNNDNNNNIEMVLDFSPFGNCILNAFKEYVCLWKRDRQVHIK